MAYSNQIVHLTELNRNHFADIIIDNAFSIVIPLLNIISIFYAMNIFNLIILTIKFKVNHIISEHHNHRYITL